MLRIVTCGLPSASTATPSTLSAHDDGGDDRLDALADAVTPVSEHETVLVVTSGWDAEPRLSRLLAVRSARESTRLVVHPTLLPPLAAGALADLVARLAAQALVAEGALLSQLRVLEQQVIGMALLGSVGRLRHPAPSVRLHARSYLPGARFLAVVDDEPRVEALQRGQTTVPLPDSRLHGGWRAALAGGDDDLDGIARQSLGEQLPGVHVDRLALHPSSAAWWGTERMVELALAPAHLPAVAALLDEAPTAPCAWCGRSVLAGPCPYCRFDGGASRLGEETVPTGGTA